MHLGVQNPIWHTHIYSSVRIVCRVYDDNIPCDHSQVQLRSSLCIVETREVSSVMGFVPGGCNGARASGLVEGGHHGLEEWGVALAVTPGLWGRPCVFI
jgi:hypothetical protein